MFRWIVNFWAILFSAYNYFYFCKLSKYSCS